MPPRLNWPNRLLFLVKTLSPSYTLMGTTGWLSELVVNTWDLVLGIRLLRSMSDVMYSPAVSIPRDRGTTSTNRISFTKVL